MHIMNTKRGVYFLADTMINESEDTETLVDIARLALRSIGACLANRSCAIVVLAVKTKNNNAPTILIFFLNVIQCNFFQVCNETVRYVSFAPTKI